MKSPQIAEPISGMKLDRAALALRAYYARIRDERGAFWFDGNTRQMAREVLLAIKYADGMDEAALIQVSNAEGIEAVSLICAWDGLIDAAITESGAA